MADEEFSQQLVRVYVPSPSAGPLVRRIARGSGIVGTPVGETRIQIDYEGNLYGAENLRTWQDRVAHAADRHLTSYPTIARAMVAVPELVRVAWYDPTSRAVNVFDHAAVAAWTSQKEDRR
jgi:hypothetical protein